MKIRLYRGPFDGKIMHSAGENVIMVSGPKRMTRKQRYEWEQERYRNGPFDFILSKSGKIKNNPNSFPRVIANYKICIGPGGYPLRHPDGSVFYEWDKPRSKNA